MQVFKNPRTLKWLVLLTFISLNVFLIMHAWNFVANFFTILMHIVIPFLVGFVLAFILLPLVDLLVSRKVPRKISVVIVVFGLTGLIVIVGYLFVPKTIEELFHLLEQIPDFASKIQNFCNEQFAKMSFIDEKYYITSEKMENFLSNNIENIIAFFAEVLQSIISYIINIVLVYVTMIYFLIYFDDIIMFLKKKTSDEKQQKIRRYFIELRNTMRAYFKGVIFVCAILAVASAVAFLLLGLDFAIILGIIIGFTDLIPYVGPYIGGGVAFLVALTISYQKAIIVVIIIVVLQMLETYVLTPKIQSKTVKTNPLLVLFSLSIFGRFFGIFGMLIAVPMLAFTITTIKTLIFDEKNV